MKVGRSAGFVTPRTLGRTSWHERESSREIRWQFVAIIRQWHASSYFPLCLTATSLYHWPLRLLLAGIVLWSWRRSNSPFDLTAMTHGRSLVSTAPRAIRY